MRGKFKWIGQSLELADPRLKSAGALAVRLAAPLHRTLAHVNRPKP